MYAVCNRSSGNNNEQLICLNNLGMEPNALDGIFEACGTLVLNDVSYSDRSLMLLTTIVKNIDKSYR